MSAEGQVYVIVEGGVVDSRINTLGTSGDDNPGTGETSDRYWLHWYYDSEGNGGFTNKGWFWENPDNYLDDAWETWRISNGYTASEYAGEVGFKKYLSEVNPLNLDHLFNIWAETNSKADFAKMLIREYGYWPEDGGCVEFT